MTSVLFLDIEGAFPNTVNEQLIRNLTKRKVPMKIVNFFKNMLKERKTRLKFDDFISEDIQIDNGTVSGKSVPMFGTF